MNNRRAVASPSSRPSLWLPGFIILGLVVFLGLGCERTPPPNVILITVDTLRSDHLGAYGHDTARTPNIDALAEDGTTFVNAFAPMGRTTPSLASMMTGLWPHQHGSREVRTPIERGRLIASTLKESGYATVGVTANRAAGRGEGLAEGFDAFAEIGGEGANEDWDANDVTGRATALVADAPIDRPLFLWVHYMDPHWPYTSPKPQSKGATRACSQLEKIPRGARESNDGEHSRKRLSACQQAYDDEIAFTDAQIGRLLAWLRENERLTNTVLLFTSDHGENFGEAGLYYAHGPNVHDASLRIPLIIAGKGFEKGATREEIVRLIDVAPTILSMAGVPEARRPSMSGVDQVGALRRVDEKESEPALAFAESGGTLVRGNHTHLLSGRPRSGYCINEGGHSLCWKGKGTPSLYDRKNDPEMSRDLRVEKPDLYAEMLRAHDRWTPGKTRERCVSDGRFKLVERPRFEGGYARTLHDTRLDPAETTDVRSKHPEAYERLSRALADWTADVPGYVQEALSDEAEAQLKALGYID